MKAIVWSKYGSPNVLQLKEVEKPTPKDDEVLIKVHAASVNPLDWHTLRGEPFLACLTNGLLKPKQTRLGVDVAGRVEAVGRNATQFQPGDEVFGISRFGSLGEYVCAAQGKIVLRPANLTFEESAAVPVAAVTALQSLRARGQVQPDQKVLINGTSGGVGTFTVQLAKAFGAKVTGVTGVTGVCSTRNLDMVRSIGADQVIDYTREDFTRNGQSYDWIIDNVGNRSVSDLRRALSPEGSCVIVGFSSLTLLFQAMLLGPLISKDGGQKVGLLGVADVNKKDMEFLKELLEAGKIKPIIDRRYPLREVPEVLRYLEQGHARGKVVITLEHNSDT